MCFSDSLQQTDLEYKVTELFQILNNSFWSCAWSQTKPWGRFLPFLSLTVMRSWQKRKTLHQRFLLFYHLQKRIWLLLFIVKSKVKINTATAYIKFNRINRLLHYRPGWIEVLCTFHHQTLLFEHSVGKPFFSPFPTKQLKAKIKSQHHNCVQQAINQEPL